jgi:hypothetical protein
VASLVEWTRRSSSLHFIRPGQDYLDWDPACHIAPPNPVDLVNPVSLIIHPAPVA